jgi:uncharacterized protein (DUF1778 family)
LDNSDIETRNIVGMLIDQTSKPARPWVERAELRQRVRGACDLRQIAVHFAAGDKTVPSAATTATTARLEARISTDLHAMLKRAAELQGRTVTDFVVDAVHDAAQRAIGEAGVIRLSLADQNRFAKALLSPPKPSPALKRAFVRRSKLLRAE